LERIIRAYPAPVYLGDGLAVLGFELGLLAKHDAGFNVSPGCEQGLKCAAPPPVRIRKNHSPCRPQPAKKGMLEAM